MSDAEPAPREWPPVDLIAGLSLETTARPESELDEKIHSGSSSPRSWITLSFIARLLRLLRAFSRAARSGPLSASFLLILVHYKELPLGTEVLEITPSGASAWVQTVRIRTRQKDGTTKDYFKKVQRIFCNRETWSNVFARARAVAWVEK